MTYPGGKNGAGVFQKIINLMPPHQVYIEPFLGSGAVMRLKRPALLNVGIDLDSAAIATFRDAAGRIVGSGDAVPIAENGVAGSRQKWREDPAPIVDGGDGRDRPTFKFEQKDGMDFLESYRFAFTARAGARELVYCDPPYLHETRTRKREYNFEMTDQDHKRLLTIIRGLPCYVIISGYWSKLYARELASWNSISFQGCTRGGTMKAEWLWFNFLEPVALHDYRYLGSDFRERERIKRKTLRWANRFSTMPVLERRALMAALELASPNA